MGGDNVRNVSRPGAIYRSSRGGELSLLNCAEEDSCGPVGGGTTVRKRGDSPVRSFLSLSSYGAAAKSGLSSFEVILVGSLSRIVLERILPYLSLPGEGGLARSATISPSRLPKGPSSCSGLSPCGLVR